MAEKTEAPTPRRREEARSKGQGVGRSHEFSMGLTLGVGVIALASLLPAAAATLSASMRTAIQSMNPHASPSALTGQLGEALGMAVSLVLPLAALVMIAGIAGQLVGGGLVFSYKSIGFQASRINPITGLKRILDRQALVRLGLASAKLGILAVITWQILVSKIPQILSTQGNSAASIAGACLDVMFQMGLTITILLAVIALTDFVIQRRRAMESIKMTKEEVKREYKEQEGDPQIRGARRRRARQLAFARMMDAIPTADVVVTNPTTLAVALKYDSLTMRAPRIVAKGQRLMAERIKEIARANRVPIVEDKPLARALFPRPVGAEVPAHLYRAVARLLVLVHQTRFGANARSQSYAAWRRQPAWNAAGAAAGSSSPWWMEAAASVGRTIGDEEIAARHGRIVEGPSEGDHHAGGTGGDYAADRGRNTIEIDEAALNEALAHDELGDLTADELAELETAADSIEAEGVIEDEWSDRRSPDAPDGEAPR